MSSYEQLHALARIILPEEIIDNFDIVDIEEKSEVLHILLDEQAVYPEGYTEDTISPNGFLPSSSIFDFPIRDRKVVLHLRRRRWVEKHTGKSLSRSWEIIAEGTRYTVGFAAFLKEVFGYDTGSDQLP
ncbi:MAG: transposase [Bacteroidales bacterium]|nr:transposase [Bacteroidales bacterium]